MDNTEQTLKEQQAIARLWELEDVIRPLINAYAAKAVELINLSNESTLISNGATLAEGYHYPPRDQADMTSLLCNLLRLTNCTELEPDSDDTGCSITFEQGNQFHLWVQDTTD